MMVDDPGELSRGAVQWWLRLAAPDRLEEKIRIPERPRFGVRRHGEAVLGEAPRGASQIRSSIDWMMVSRASSGPKLRTAATCRPTTRTSPRAVS